MYYVYRLEFGEHEYIGCTNNIRRRKDQHNGKAQSGASKLGRFMKEHGIVLKTDDFQILASLDDRHEALMMERATAQSAESKGAKLLNDNYSRDCTRKGKNIGNTAKEYVVVDYKAHTVTTVTNLRQYCLKNGYDYKLVQRTVKPGRHCNYGIKVFYTEDWAMESNKDKYLSGEFIDEVTDNAIAERVEKTSKAYDVRFPDGHTETIRNLDKFARDHGINAGNLHATLMYKRPTKGYQVLRRI